MGVWSRPATWAVLCLQCFAHSALLTVLCSQCFAHSALLTPDANISISNSSCGEGDSCESISNEMEEVQVNGSFRSVIKVNGDTEERYLFPPHLLEKLQEEDADKIPAIPSVDPGLLLRPLLLSDFNSGFLPLLAQLTSVGEVTWQQWEDRWNQLRAASGYFIIVVEDVAEEKVVGAATLLLGRKFIHQCGQVGRVEDVVVSDEYRGRQLGKLLVSSCSLLAKRLNCYKVTLNCNDKMVKFYTSLGSSCEQGNANYMCIRLDK